MRLLLSGSDKVIGQLEAKIEGKMQEDRQKNIKNTTLKKLEQTHSRFK